MVWKGWSGYWFNHYSRNVLVANLTWIRPQLDCGKNKFSQQINLCLLVFGRVTLFHLFGQLCLFRILPRIHSMNKLHRLLHRLSHRAVETTGVQHPLLLASNHWTLMAEWYQRAVITAVFPNKKFSFTYCSKIADCTTISQCETHFSCYWKKRETFAFSCRPSFWSGTLISVMFLCTDSCS